MNSLYTKSFLGSVMLTDVLYSTMPVAKKKESYLFLHLEILTVLTVGSFFFLLGMKLF